MCFFSLWKFNGRNISHFFKDITREEKVKKTLQDVANSRLLNLDTNKIQKTSTTCRSRIQRLSSKVSINNSKAQKSSDINNVQKKISSQKENESEEKYFKSILEKKTLQPIKTTSLGVLLVLVDK